MSDRGYKALAYQIRMEAIKARIEAMKVRNEYKRSIESNLAYNDDDFFGCANELNNLANEVMKLAEHGVEMKPTIDELETILKEDDIPVRILPDGSIEEMKDG